MQNLQLWEVQAEKVEKEVQELEQVETELRTERAAKKDCKNRSGGLGKSKLKRRRVRRINLSNFRMTSVQSVKLEMN